MNSSTRTSKTGGAGEHLLARLTLVTLLIAAMATSLSYANDDDSGIEPKTHSTHLPPITAVTIQNNGATYPGSGNAGEQCEKFKLSELEVRHYISSAAGVTEQDYLHMLDWSPCYASGRVTFKNGATGEWSIQQYRAGSLTLSDGQRLFLYCPQCQANGFEGSEE